MRRCLYLVAAALTLGISANVFAQGGGGGMGGGGGTGGGTGTSGGTSSFTGGTGTSGGTSFTGSTGGTSFTGGGTTGTTGGTGGGMRGGGAGGTTFTPSPTNFLTKTWANPLYPGRPGSTNISAKSIGGFGQPSYGTVSTGTTGGRAGGGTATANRGGTGTNTGTSTGGSVIPITYALEVKFPAPSIATPQFQADLQSVVSGSSLLRSPGNVRLEVVGTTVVLRGIVADEDEKRLVEGMVRLEPGVHAVQNELAVIPPKP